MEARSAWTANVWGQGDDSHHERRVLAKGEESCCICLTNPVEVKFKPCNHDVCLECCNRMRAANVFKADAGIRCALCRQYIEMYTDLNGNPSTVPSLQKANLAAAKSKAGRQAGSDAAVSTSVPDPSRLVPPVTARAEPTWYCDKCRHLNTGNKPECSRCRCANPNHVKANTSKDPLNCLPDEIVKLAKEKHHPNLNKAFMDAGTPWAQGKIGGTVEGIRRALRTKGHERLMRVVKVLTEGHNIESVALDLLGNYTVQSLLEATHKLRGVAASMVQQGHHPSEAFSVVTGVTAANAFGLLLRALVAAMGQLASDAHGVHCLVCLTHLAAPAEVIHMAQKMVPECLGYLNTPLPHPLLFVTNMVERLHKLRFEVTTHSTAAATLLAGLCAQYCANQKQLMYTAKHQYSGPMVVLAIEGGLPSHEAFKAAWSVATSAQMVVSHRNGARTLELLCAMKPADGRCSEMIRDIACYVAKALQGSFAEVAMRREDHGEKLVKALLQQLQAHREDDWVEWITSELVMAADRLAGDRDGRDLLQSTLSMPTLTSDLLAQHMRRLQDSVGANFGAIQQQVQSNRASPDKLPRKLHAEPSEVSPFAPTEILRKFPRYLREGHAHQHGHGHGHSMLRKHVSMPAGAAENGATAQQQQQQHGAAAAAGGAGPSGAAAGAAAAGVPPPPPPPPPLAVSRGKSAPPGFVGSGAPPQANGSVSFPTVPQPTAAPPQQQQQQQQPLPAPAPACPAATASPAAGSSASRAAQAAVPPPPPLQPAVPPPAAAHAPTAAPPGFGPPGFAPAAPALAAPQVHPPRPPPPLQAAQPAAAAPAAAPGLPPHLTRVAQVALEARSAPQQPPHLPPHLAAAMPHQAHYPQQQAVGQQGMGQQGASQPMMPPHPSDPSLFFPRPPSHPTSVQPSMHNAAPATAPATPLPPPPPLAPAQQTPAAQQAPPAPAAHPSAAASIGTPPAFGGFLSLPEMLAQLTMGAEAAAPLVPAPAPAPAAAPRPAAAAGRPGGSYRPNFGAAAAAAPAGPKPPSFAAPAPAAAVGSGASYRAPAPPPPRAAPGPGFAYMQQQAALPQQPAALFHSPPPAAPAPLPPPQRPQQQQQHSAPRPQQQPQHAAPRPQQQPARPASWNAVAAPGPEGHPSAGPAFWACKVCTYEHHGKEANYLACALCGAPQT